MSSFFVSLILDKLFVLIVCLYFKYFNNKFFFKYFIVYYEKDGDEVVQHRSQPDVVTLPDYEILQV